MPLPHLDKGQQNAHIRKIRLKPEGLIERIRRLVQHSKPLVSDPKAREGVGIVWLEL